MDRIILRYWRAVAVFLAVVLSGCYSSSRVTEFQHLREASNQDLTIRLLAVDSTLYTLDTFAFTDSTIFGVGTGTKGGVTAEFEDTLNFSDIVFIERVKRGNSKALWVVPMAIAVGAGLSALMSNDEFEIIRKQELEGSCPFIYSYDGSGYVMEAEAFSTSISRSLETRTFHLLPSLVAEEGSLNIRIANERPETHLVNSVHLYAVDVENAATPVPDTENLFWPVTAAEPPVTAVDHAGRNVRDSLSEKDGRYWISDLDNITTGSGFRDRLTLQFDMPEGRSEALLILNAINTFLSTEIYRSVGSILDDQNLRFYRALEEDQELIELMLDWIRTSSLTVEVEQDGHWREVGVIPPEANIVPFTRAIQLKHLARDGKPLTIRLSALTDVWKIDAVTLAPIDTQPLSLHPLKLRAIEASAPGPGIDRDLAVEDSSYAMVLPPDYLDLSFDDAPSETMDNPAYVIAVSGFMYEWFPESDRAIAAAIADVFSDVDRLKLLKQIVRREELFLPPIYARWSRSRR